jgi:acyl-coenzyme A synthetase/AMP-(fatty) acid ligase
VRRTSKITPGEVESALDLHPAVAMSAVVGVQDQDEGEVPVAFVVTRPGMAVSRAVDRLPCRTHRGVQDPRTNPLPRSSPAHR